MASERGGWSLLGGSDSWQPLTRMDLGRALGVGLLADTYDCSSSRICSWPLPRSRAQGWVLSGRVYLFSGMLSIVDQAFDELRTQTLLLNDLWSFDPSDSADQPQQAADLDTVSSTAGARPASQKVAMARVAACSEFVDAPDVLPADGAPYPGARFSAAIWTAKLDGRHKTPHHAHNLTGSAGWLFGGIGRRTPNMKSEQRERDRDAYAQPTDTRGFGNYPGTTCVADDIIGGAQFAVRNLCDLWVFVPGQGFRLVLACENDVAELSVYNGPVPMVRLSEGPTAAIFGTTWVTYSNDPWGARGPPSREAVDVGAQAASLWMLGGLTSCDPFDGVAADGQNASDPLIMGPLMDLPRSHDDEVSHCTDPGYTSDEWNCYETTLRDFYLVNMTMCDMSLPGHGIAVAGMGAGHPAHQSCTNDLWRFDVLTEMWEQIPAPARSPETGSSDAWPEARCGAVSLLRSSTSAPTSSVATEHPAMVSFVGGWGGASSGECEEWPEDTRNCTATPTGKDVCHYALQSFESKDLPSLQVRHKRAYAATCEPLAETWDFGMLTTVVNA